MKVADARKLLRRHMAPKDVEWLGHFGPEVVKRFAEGVVAAERNAWHEGFASCADWWEIHHYQEVAAAWNPHKVES